MFEASAKNRMVDFATGVGSKAVFVRLPDPKPVEEYFRVRRFSSTLWGHMLARPATWVQALR
eukprot:12396342-Alexandrium_andersonii.AAC.1